MYKRAGSAPGKEELMGRDASIHGGEFIFGSFERGGVVLSIAQQWATTSQRCMSDTPEWDEYLSAQRIGSVICRPVSMVTWLIIHLLQCQMASSQTATKLKRNRSDTSTDGQLEIEAGRREQPASFTALISNLIKSLKYSSKASPAILVDSVFIFVQGLRYFVEDMELFIRDMVERDDFDSTCVTLHSALLALFDFLV
jgi:hypothetical protein